MIDVDQATMGLAEPDSVFYAHTLFWCHVRILRKL